MNSGTMHLAGPVRTGAIIIQTIEAIDPAWSAGWIIIDPFTTKCEIRKITDISFRSVTVDAAFKKFHRNNAVVFCTTESTRNVLLFGARGDGTHNDTPAFKAAMETGGHHVLVPAGIYVLEDLDIPSTTFLDCQPNTIIKGRTEKSALIRTQGSKGNIRISGGSWRDCGTVFIHRGTSALFRCTFEKMSISHCKCGFRLGAVVSSTWRDCEIHNAPRGLWFGGKSNYDHQCNANRIERLTCTRISISAITFAGFREPCADNSVIGCIIENSKVAIYGVMAYGLLVESLYTEKLTGTDITLENSKNSVIRNSWLGPATSSGEKPEQRILIKGNGGVTVEHCNLVLSPPPQVAVEVSHSRYFETLLFRNYLNATGQRRPYAERLVKGTNVTIVPYKGSGGVS